MGDHIPGSLKAVYKAASIFTFHTTQLYMPSAYENMTITNIEYVSTLQTVPACGGSRDICLIMLPTILHDNFPLHTYILHVIMSHIFIVYL